MLINYSLMHEHSPLLKKFCIELYYFLFISLIEYSSVLIDLMSIIINVLLFCCVFFIVLKNDAESALQAAYTVGPLAPRSHGCS